LSIQPFHLLPKEQRQAAQEERDIWQDGDNYSGSLCANTADAKRRTTKRQRQREEGSDAEETPERKRFQAQEHDLDSSLDGNELALLAPVRFVKRLSFTSLSSFSLKTQLNLLFSLETAPPLAAVPGGGS
jgi:hypothetical protein